MNRLIANSRLHLLNFVLVGSITFRQYATSAFTQKHYLNPTIAKTTTSNYRISSSLSFVSPLLRNDYSSSRLLSSNNNNQQSSTTTTTATKITLQDCQYMQQALQHAQHGKGHSFPNPAVGCVLVSSTGSILGAGFHPQAGYPHAEIFALLEACAYVESGVEAALAIVNNNNDNELVTKIDEFLELYTSGKEPFRLFKDACQDQKVTAYVTLEPCCHYGRTPPCAAALSHAGVDRVVVGLRDPNPRVDGGGVFFLQQEGLLVDSMILDGIEKEEETKVAGQCLEIVRSFVKRISPDQIPVVDSNDNDSTTSNPVVTMNGAKRSILRSLAGKWKKDGSITEISWPWKSILDTTADVKMGMEEAVAKATLNPKWMEEVDTALWEKELILLRLNKAIAKKSGVKLLGKRIAKELVAEAHVAQVIGHTVLLYRPGFPPVLDFDTLLKKEQK